MVEADLAELDAAAKKLSEAGCALGGFDLAPAVEQLPTALAGAATGAAALGVALRLSAAVQVYAARVNEMASAAGQSATNYREIDAEVAARFDRILRS